MAIPINEIHWAVQSEYPILATLQLLPLLAMFAALFFKEQAYRIGVIASLVEIGVVADLFQKFDATNAALQFGEKLNLLPPLNYHAAVDGASILFIMLTAIIGLLVVLYGKVRPLNPQWKFIAVVLATQVTLMGMFVTHDMLWFILLSAIQLIPIGYLLTQWSTSPEKELALARFVQFMGTGLLLLAVGTFMIGWNYAQLNNGIWSFNVTDLEHTSVPSSMQSVLFFLLFYGLAVRIPLFPMHGWLPMVAEHGSVAAAPIFLLGLKTGIYGLLRFVLPVVPEAVIEWAPFVVAFAVAGIFYAALLAMLQNNLRRLFAFAVVSHTSIVIIGLFSLNLHAFQGSVMLSINFGLAIAGLLLMAGLVYRRTKTLLLSNIGGLFDHIPIIGVAFFLAGLSIVGMPGTPGFDAAHLVMEAAMERYGALMTIAAALGNVVAAGFLLWAFQRAFLAPVRKEKYRGRVIERASGVEITIALATIIILLLAGFFTAPWLEVMEHSFDGLSAIYGGGH
ncbi:MAG: NADH-quinone oxidoreductase subunit M [Gammaproteobacteria bacterium]|nr:NADH-quinone oxidoreductase subunit M [Gammaproteobacteria bacterium]